MEIKCTVEELKELAKLINNTPVAGTTGVNVKIKPLKNITFTEKIAKSLANRGIHEEQLN